MVAPTIAPLTQRAAWIALGRHLEESGDAPAHLFAEDPGRGERLTAEGAGLYLDYSKNRVTDETLRLLVALAEECDLPERREAMFRGEKINVTEGRAVLHVALRAARRSLIVDGEDVVPEVHAVLDQMSDFASGCAPASGAATPAGPSATWSTSGSAAPTWGR